MDVPLGYTGLMTASPVEFDTGLNSPSPLVVAAAEDIDHANISNGKLRDAEKVLADIETELAELAKRKSAAEAQVRQAKIEAKETAKEALRCDAYMQWVRERKILILQVGPCSRRVGA